MGGIDIRNRGGGHPCLTVGLPGVGILAAGPKQEQRQGDEHAHGYGIAQACAGEKSR